MSKVKIAGHASGSGTLTIQAPDTSSSRTITLPDATGTLLNSDGSGASLTNLPYFATSGLSAKDLGDGLHIKTGDSGASVNANFSSLVIEDDTHSGLSILSGASSDGAIYFGDSGGADMCQIKYQHATNQLVFETNQANALTITSDGRGLSQFTAKTWIDFNGDGTVAIRDSHNVAGLGDEGTGYYTVSHDVNLATVNGAAVASASDSANTFGKSASTAQQATASFTVMGFLSSSGAAADHERFYAIVFGD